MNKMNDFCDMSTFIKFINVVYLSIESVVSLFCMKLIKTDLLAQFSLIIECLE